jgi:hypothetical protein
MVDTSGIMLRALLHAADRHVAHLPGWLMLFGGVALLACTILLPPWLETRELNWQREVMALQADRLAQQERNYRQFHEALAADEPAVITRLAFVHLRLKPAGSAPVGMTTIDPHSGITVRFVSAPDDPRAAAAFIRQCLDQPGSAAVETWLHEPMPEMGVDYQPLPAVRGRIVRLANGPMRLPLTAAAICCIAVGLVPPSGASISPGLVRGPH